MALPRADVFLSYSSADQNVARRLANDLKSAGIAVWYDEFRLKAGDPILHTIREGIERADVLLVLVSKNSIASKWVDRELRDAFEQFGERGAPVIIPVCVDDAPVPEFLKSIKQVDLGSDYDEGLRQILRALEMRRPDEAARDVIDATGLAQALAKERGVERGLGFYITSGLTALTIVATLFAAWPAFVQTFGDRPQLFYSVTQSQLMIPRSLDGDRIRKMLRNEGIPDANVRIQVVNQGARQASEIKIGLSVDGALSSIKTEPDPSGNPVWVSITPPDLSQHGGNATLVLKNLVPNRIVSAEYVYHGASAKYSCDVVADGLLAEQVADVALVPQWSLWQTVRRPVLLLAGGLAISIGLGVFVAAWRNAKFRSLILEVLDVVSPVSARLLSLFTR